MTTTFDVRRTVRSVIDDTDLASPREIAAKTAEMVPDEHLRDALATALVSLAHDEVTRSRMATAALNANPSAKVAAIRAAAETWRRALHDRVHVGAGDWKLLADCTHTDLMFAADERRDMARRNAARADWYAALAELVAAHGAGRVGDVPDADLRSHLAPEVQA